MTRALILIDLQKSFLADPLWSVNSNPDLLEAVDRLLAVARAAGDPVFWVLHSEPGSGGAFDPELGQVELFDGLQALPGETVLHKRVHNAFTTTALQLLLVSQGVTELVIAGIRTEQCVETTTRVGADLGYEVTLVLDATATTPREHWAAPQGRSVAEVLADPLTLPTAAILERVAYALAGRFATIATVAEIEAAAAVPVAVAG